MEMSQAIVAQALVKVGPEILRTLIEDVLKLSRGLAKSPGPKVGTPLIIMIERGNQRGIVMRHRRGQVGASGRRLADTIEPGAGPAPGRREIQPLQHILAGRIGLGRWSKTQPQLGRHDRQVEQVGPDDFLGSRVERSGVRAKEQVTLIPDGTNVPDQGTRLLGRRELDAMAEANQFSQFMERDGFLASLREGKLVISDWVSLSTPGIARARSSPRPSVCTASVSRPSVGSFDPSCKAASISESLVIERLSEQKHHE